MRNRKNNLISRFLDIFIKFLEYFSLKYKFQLLNSIKNLLFSFKTKVFYLVESKKWIIYWVGKYITENLKKESLIKAEIAYPNFAKKKIIHYGSISCFIQDKEFSHHQKFNKTVLTWFHIIQNEEKLKFIPVINKKIDIIHTTNYITKNLLIEYGVKEEKIVVIPLGIDLSIFKPYSEKERKKLRKKLKIPLDKTIIGSFQKDGIGWGEGLKPKWEKGPDIFCKVIKKISETNDIFILLTGPARGFVKNKLTKYKIPYYHTFLENYLDIVSYYNLIDLYIITSRVEGGPKGLLEAMATGIPLVSTKVGMAPEIIKQNFNGFIAEIDNIDQIYHYALKIIEDKNLRKKITNNALKVITRYSWEKIAKEYYYKIYKKLLDK